MKEYMEKSPWVEQIEKTFVPELPYPTLPVSLVLPVYNCSERAAISLESIRRQNYPHVEVIVIDAGSTDRTLEVVTSYLSMIHRIYTVKEYNITEMMNCGISLASGKYITFLFPGSFYLSSYALPLMAEVVIRENYPDIMYSGSIQKERKRPAQLIQNYFDKDLLAKGVNPATVVATWFRSDLFTKIGKFDAQYTMRAEFEFFCRCSQEKSSIIKLINRVLVDFDYGPFSYGKHVRIFQETFHSILHHFGLKKALSWMLSGLFSKSSLHKKNKISRIFFINF